jgi:lysophospholipase L1-like esterase
MEKEKNIKPINQLGAVLIILGSVLLVTVLLINSGGNLVGIYESLIYVIIGIMILFGFSTFIFSDKPLIEKINLRSNRWIKFLLGPIMILIGITLMFLGLEITARIIINNNPSFRLHRLNAQPDYVFESPAYEQADFNHASFFEERFDPSSVFLVKDEVHGFVVPQNFSGEYINIIDHRRYTVGQPPGAAHTVYLFGGSTIFNIEVPDQYTVASHLQALLNEEFPGTYQVENMGVLGVTSGEQLKRLYTLDIREGDIIIFFDGINDVIRNLQYQGSGLMKTLDKSYLYKYFLKAYIQSWIPKYELPNQLEIQSDYLANIEAARSYADEHDAAFFHFLQPNIYFIANPSAYEKDIISSLEKDYPGWEVGITYGYTGLTEAHRQMVETGIPSFDLRYILSHETRGNESEIFFDDVHVNHIGNQIIAKSIFEIISNQLPGK